MDTSQTPFDWIALLPLVIMGIGLSISASLLAKDKGRNRILWSVIGFVPLLNIWFLFYLVGSSNLRLEKKIDTILSKLGKSADSE